MPHAEMPAPAARAEEIGGLLDAYRDALGDTHFTTDPNVSAARAKVDAAVAELVRERDEARREREEAWAMAMRAESERARATYSASNALDVAELDARWGNALLDVDRLTRDNRQLRKNWWLAHGHNWHGITALYGDDGEMQCNACMIDFKRDAIGDIEARLYAIGVATLTGGPPHVP